MATIEKATRIAEENLYHRADKAGTPLFHHSLRVMLHLIAEVRKSGQPLAQAELPIVGILHDVVEDGGVTLEALRAEGFSESIVDAVDRLTKPRTSVPVAPGEYPPGYLDRIKGCPVAVGVKLADLKDNLNPARLPNPGEDDLVRTEKHRRAYDELVRWRHVS